MTAGPKIAFLLVALAGVSLSGCVTQQQIAAVPAPAASVRVVTVAPTVYNKTALSGQTTRIDFSSELNPDCSVRNIPTVRIIDAPVHGTTQVTQLDDFTAFLPQNVHFACNKKKSRGTALDYISNPGYVGGDYLSFESVNPDGVDRTYKVAITVK
jgi:hypothetical protein